MEQKSIALMPLDDGASIGFLMLGSLDPNQFDSDRRVDYLMLLGEVVAVALAVRETAFPKTFEAMPVGGIQPIF